MLFLCGVDGTGKACGDLCRAGNGTAHHQCKGTGFQCLDRLLRVVDVTLGNDLCRALCGQLADEVKIDIVNAGGLRGVAAHGSAHKVGTGFGAEHGVFKVIAISHHQLLMADCDNVENALACAAAGADFVGTTMRGYTPETEGCDDIDFDFVHTLATQCPAKVIAEGHIHYPEQAVKALEAGAFALVVGGAITRPAEITARFTGAIHAMNK